MLISITIPTLKTKEQLKSLIQEITNNTHDVEYELIYSCIQQSAAKNRNWCIDNSKGDIIIQMDDDMTGFYEGWCSSLIKPLIDTPEKYSIVASRLLDKNKNIGPMLGDGNNKLNINEPYVKAIHTKETGLNLVCSACIAFKRCNVRFCEDFLGATYEDSYFAFEMNKAFPDKIVIINNLCKLIHLGESKGRQVGGVNAWAHNRKLFHKLTGIYI
jgi:glycosyltransferase involved in cell wall biosynthesis